MGVVVGCSYDVECVDSENGLWKVVGYDIFDGIQVWDLVKMDLFCDDYFVLILGKIYYYCVVVKNEFGKFVLFNVISIIYYQKNQVLVIKLNDKVMIMQDKGIVFDVCWQDDNLFG